ncbi:unnamed protein product [Chrysodeixis includens]|uniref:C2H2-type domain-containing protein n=1 Tax=Chrysodeixis includens TaxID=689277 RepID=A0A9P0FZX8_CHRIL|nr:unnamed protein product [Chrysodeixis includens]
MEGEESNLSQGPYPILFIPKVCTPLETNCEMSENVFIHVNISTPDTDGNDAIIYKGFCNVKVTKSNDINVTYGANDNDCKDIPVILAEANQISFPAYNDSQVWIDPARSPYVYNRCDSPPQEAYTIHETRDNHITIEQHNTYITQNVYNYNETVRYSPTSEEHKTVKKGRTDSYNMYEEDEFECGVFLSQLSEEIINEKEIRDRDERKFVGLKTDNEALKQLMSSDIQSASRQQKTILFLGHDAEYGQTIQNISLNDPTVECLGNSDREVEVTADDSKSVHPQAKRYQCNKCKQIFDQLAEFKQHMVGNHRLSNLCDVSDDVKFMCQECGKYLKNQDKFEKHCLGHGDPDLECDKCHKVFASKFTLRNHMKIHTRRYLCSYCPKSYGTPHQLYTHAEKSHFRFMCDFCPFVSDNYTELKAHKDEGHQNSSSSSKESSVSKYNEDLFEDISSDMSLADEVKQKRDDRIQTADSVIAKVMANRLFQELAKNKKTRKCKKVRIICDTFFV